MCLYESLLHLSKTMIMIEDYSEYTLDISDLVFKFQIVDAYAYNDNYFHIDY